MSKTSFAAVTVLSTVCAALPAADMTPGLWKITMESSVAATPDWKPEPFSLTQCLSADDAQHPDRLLSGMGGQGVSGCDFSNRQESAGRLSFDVKCAGTLGMGGHGDVTYSATSMEGVLNVNFGEEKTAMQNKISATYLGNCTAGAGGVPGMGTPMGQ